MAIATSSYWVRPRHQIMVAAAPYAMAQSSPLLMRAQRAETRRAPDQASRIAWEYAVRPPRRMLEEAAAELRRFDARTMGRPFTSPCRLDRDPRRRCHRPDRPERRRLGISGSPLSNFRTIIRS